MKEQKLITTSNKEISFYGQRFTHTRPGQFSQMAVQWLEDAFKISLLFFSEQYSDFNKVYIFFSIDINCFVLPPLMQV